MCSLRTRESNRASATASDLTIYQRSSGQTTGDNRRADTMFDRVFLVCIEGNDFPFQMK